MNSAPVASTKKSPFVLEFKPQAGKFKKLSKSAARIAKLLRNSKVKASRQMTSCLDDLLGAVYALVFAARENFIHRVGKPPESDKVVIRADQLAGGIARIDGTWMAGFHLNSALFRLSATYDRILKASVGTQGDLGTRREKAECQYGWTSTNIRAIHGQTTDLKHTPQGSHEGRRANAGLPNAIDALEELISLIEKWEQQR